MPRPKPEPKPCEQCGKTIYVVPSKAHRKRFCSRRCLGLSRPRENLIAGGNPSGIGGFKLGENLGPDHPNWVPPIRLTCEHCGCMFEKKPWELKGTHKGRFCSAACRGKWRSEHGSGENAPDWVGGPKTYRGRGWREARAIVVSEQGGDCAMCGKHVGKSLPVHHIRPFREFATVDEANARANLVGLCQSCHMRSEPRDRRAAQVATS